MRIESEYGTALTTADELESENPLKTLDIEGWREIEETTKESVLILSEKFNLICKLFMSNEKEDKKGGTKSTSKTSTGIALFEAISSIGRPNISKITGEKLLELKYVLFF